MAIRPDYSAGTVSITAGTTALVGAGGANWLGADIQPGDTFLVQNLVAVVAAVVDATHITLASNWTGTTLAAAPYRIRYQPDGSRYSAAARDLIDQLGNGNVLALSGLTGALDEIPIFTGAGAMTTISRINLTQGVDVDAKVETLAARTAYDGSTTGFSVLVADVGDGRSAIYFKVSNTSGDWSDPAYLTGPNGSFQSKGTYSAATAYVVGDVVLQNGSSWIARVNTTGNAPPTLPTTSNTQWFLLSAAGNGFVFRGAYSGATAYVKDDVVLYNNSTWIALISTTGNTPPALPTTVNTQWSLIAAKGAGDVSGPASSTTNNLMSFSDATGKVAKDSGILAANVYQKSNILGTVSQSSGVPTGAIIEKGSNGNGEYVRYADGTQITWGLQAVNGTVAAGQAATPAITQPAAFTTVAKTLAQFAFYTGASGVGNALYAVPFGSSFTNNSTSLGVVVLNQGNPPASTFPSFTLGTTAAASLLINFITFGRWF